LQRISLSRLAALAGAALLACAGAGQAAAPVFPGATRETIPAVTRSAACRRDLDATMRYLRTLSSTALMAEQNGRVLYKTPRSSKPLTFSRPARATSP